MTSTFKYVSCERTYFFFFFFLSDNLLFPFGHDFAFDDAAAMFENMEKLITEINANPVKYGVKLTYKTLSEYFDAIQSAPPANGWPDFSLPKDYLPFEDIPCTTK